MFEFLENIESMHRIFWYVALAASLIFLLQTFMTFLGSDAHDGTAADFDGNLDHADAPFQLFSLRNLINFLLGFGWTGVAFFNEMENKYLLIVLAIFVGIIFVMLFFFLIKQILKLTEDNTFNIEKLKNKTGDVYLNIPANMSGKGKILISYNGSSHELSAMTRSEEILTSGTPVKVNEIEDGILIVSRM
jgi:membrane protein implicated in regulation of membrane protease activity